MIPESNDVMSGRLEECSSSSVARLAVLAAIKLNDQLPLGAEEIDDIGTDRGLSPKLVAAKLAVTQSVPKDSLYIRHGAAQALGMRADLAADEGHVRKVAKERPSPNPLPQAGEGYRERRHAALCLLVTPVLSVFRR